MCTTILLRETGGRVVCRRCALANTPARRLLGLLGRRELESDEGLLLVGTASIHTAFMRFAIDVVFLGDGEVLRVVGSLGPWRAVGCRGARAVLELPAGACARDGPRPGETLRFDWRAARGATYA